MNQQPSIADDINARLDLEDEVMHNYIERHNFYLTQIEQFEEELENGTLNQNMIGNLEYWYFKAQLYAYSIAGYYRGRQKYYEGMADIKRADKYEEVRLRQYNDKLTTVGDAENISRGVKGDMINQSGKYEGDYKRWSGIAESYGNAILSLKDKIKGHKAEQDGQAFDT